MIHQIECLRSDVDLVAFRDEERSGYRDIDPDRGEREARSDDNSFVRSLYTFFGQTEAMRSVRTVTTNIGQTPSLHRGPALDLRAQILDRMNQQAIVIGWIFLTIGLIAGAMATAA
jgi:hypothetical protein